MRNHANPLWIATAIATFLTGCRSGETPKAEAPGNPQEKAGIVRISDEGLANLELKTEIVRKGDIPEIIALVGRIAADSNRVGHVASMQDGRLARLVPATGERVEKGAVVAEIESPEFPGRPVPLRAPLSGIVVARGAAEGAFVEKGRDILAISDLDAAWLVGEVREKDAGRVRAGQGARFRIPSFPGEAFTGTVSRVGSVVESDSRSLEVRIPLKEGKKRLKPGMFAEIELEVGRISGVLCVDESAVQSDGEDRIAFVRTGKGTFERRVVRIGRSGAGRLEITEGLAEGDEVVTEGGFTLKSELAKGELGEE